ncbi:MAG: type II toxin-antitoxin system VapC family toxin [Solirubrobacteraceae bacterium]
MKGIALRAERRLIYADSSALVKLVIEETESVALQRHLEGAVVLATSRIALVEVSRAAVLANPHDAVRDEVERLVAGCMLVAVSAQLLRAARKLASSAVRTLDAIHLASALRIDPDEFLAYDRRLLAAAAEHGLSIASPSPEATS